MNLGNWLLGGASGLVIVTVLALVAYFVIRSRASREAPRAKDAAKAAFEQYVPAPLRMGVMLVATVVLALAIFWVARQQLGVIVYKAALLTMAAVVGYWVDRTAFPLSRPHMFGDAEVRWRYEIRRAYVICAAMLTAGLGA